MPRERLASAYLYYDAATDDARLTLAIVRTAARHGAVVANRSRVTSFTRDGDGRIDGAVVDTGETRAHRSAPASSSARTGVWTDEVRALDEEADPDSIRPAKGIHLTVPWDKVRNDIAVVIPVPRDRRSLFVVPWGPKPDGTYEHTYIGTTDTDYDGPLDDPQCTGDDVAYVLGALNHSITTGVTADDVTGQWAGLRPLVKAASSGRTADLSRGHQVASSDAGLIRITGGKLTTYRGDGRRHGRRRAAGARRAWPVAHQEAEAGRRRRLQGSATRVAPTPTSPADTAPRPPRSRR